MKLKQVLALTLCIFMLFFILAGCGGSDEEIPDEPDGEIPGDPVTDPHIHDDDCYHSVDFDAAIAFFPPETIMLYADTLTITWAELYVFLFGMVSNLVHAYGPSLDWTEMFDPNTTLADAVLEYATEEALSFLSISYGISSIGLTLSDEDYEEFNEFLFSLIEEYGSKEALEETLRLTGGFYNLEVFENLFKLEFSLGILINEFYGEDASSFPDEKVAEYAEQNSYMMAKHILRQKTDDDTAFNEIEDIFKQLEAYIDSEDLFDVFTELMFEHSEDPGGLMSYPEGYLFQHKDMVEPFSDACTALEIGQLSEIVETDYGYHIILRLPINYDSTPIAFSYEGIYRTLRQHVAFVGFDALQQEWRDSLNIIFSPVYLSIDLAEIFKLH